MSTKFSDVRWVVSVKGVVYDQGRVLLAKNDRDEWELPGGQLERGETPHACVEREVLEETGLTVRAGPLIDAYVFEVVPSKDVLILAYGCTLTCRAEDIRRSQEHTDLRFFSTAELPTIPLPERYRAVIGKWPVR